MAEKHSSDPDAIDMGWRSSPGAQRRAVAVVALVAVGAAGYLLGRGTAAPDVTVDGQVAYACALAERIRESHPSGDDWGDVDKDRAYSEIFAIPGLLGHSMGRQEANALADVGWDRLRDPQGEDPFGEVLDATLEECVRR